MYGARRVGDQACGENGPGRMLEPLDIASKVDAMLTRRGPLQGKRVLVTAGPTRECIDPVRFVSNRSSGKMGFAMAQALHEAGAIVTLVSGPVSLPTPTGVRRVDVESSDQMYAAVQRELPGTAIFVGTAAVADYRPMACAEQKIKKTSETISLELTRTTDILAQVSASAQRPFVVGFAAETQSVEQHARAKLIWRRTST
jgi:phosphopantothenoylcysteine decarboxylase/phosphopantothenate--cysteine ligase